MIGRIKERIMPLMDWYKQSRLARMLARYGAVNGSTLAGGIAYAALFSIFAGLAIIVTVFMRVLGGNPEILDAVIGAIDEAIPGILDVGEDGGPIDPQSLVQPTGLNLTTVIASVALLFSALSVMTALGRSLAAVFGLTAQPRNFVVAKVRDLLGFIVLATGVLLSAVVGIGSNLAGEWLSDLLNLDPSAGRFLIWLLGVVASFALDTLVFAAIITSVGGAHPLARDLWFGSALGAVGTGILRALGTTVVGNPSDDPVLASFAVGVTLLLWVNLAARIMLYVAAWTANPPAPEAKLPASELHLMERPNFVTVSAPHTLEWDHDSRTGAVQPTEATRLEREKAERDRAAHEREIAAALDGAVGARTWFGRRSTMKRARAASRRSRSEYLRAEAQREGMEAALVGADATRGHAEEHAAARRPADS